MPVALIALLLAGDIVNTAPPAPPAASTPASAPQGVVGVDLPAFPKPVRPVYKAPERSWDRPSPELGFNSIPMLGEQAPPPPPSATAADPGSRCRRKETANGFTYSCGDPETARSLEEETERLLNDLLDPR
jgi:hypothetical protein